MDRNEAIKKIINIPHDYHEVKTKSIYVLYGESGYLEYGDSIEERDIENALRANPETAEEWITYSDDKRTTSGWGMFYYFVTDTYGAGYVSDGVSDPNPRILMNKFEACAYFIKREMEDVGSRFHAWKTKQRGTSG